MNFRNLLGQRAQAQRIREAQLLTAEGQTYFDQILTEYEILPRGASPANEELELRKVVDAIVAKQQDNRTWGDLFAFEIVVVKLKDEDTLRRSTWAIRCKYKDLAGDKAWDSYQASSPPDPKSAPENELRADTLRILTEFHWIYAFAPLREKLRSHLIKLVFTITLVCLGILLLFAAYAYGLFDGRISDPELRKNTPVLLIVIAMGLIGGFVSLLQRVQSVPSTGDPIVNIAELSNSQFGLYLAPIHGAVFAVLLYIVFIGGLLSGPLFPKTTSPPDRCAQTSTANGANQTPAPADASRPMQPDKTPCSYSVEFSDFLKQTGPKSGADFGILLFWGFVAGFAERFVPDTIDRLVNQAAKK